MYYICAKKKDKINKRSQGKSVYYLCRPCLLVRDPVRKEVYRFDTKIEAIIMIEAVRESWWARLEKLGVELYVVDRSITAESE